MRVITGDFRGRKLESPPGINTRPTSDKVKEAIFNILMNDIDGKIYIDLFAGSGSLGIEALSRGAKSCIFCDSSREAIAFIRKNIEACKAEAISKIVWGDYKKALGSLREAADVFLLDPPYDSNYYEEVLESISDRKLISQDGVIVCEHDIKREMPQQIGSLRLYQQKKYGRIGVTIYRNGEEENE